MAHLARLSARRSQTRALTDDEVAELDEAGGKCTYCGGYHPARGCPRVKRLEFHPSGVVAAVEFWRDDEINWEGVVWADAGGDDPLSPDVVADLNLLLGLTRHVTTDPHATQAINRLAAWLEVVQADAVQSRGEDPA
jgi:hypothetical protein